MKFVFTFVLTISLIAGISPLYARPLITEPAPSLGKFSFESGLSISFRRDDFGFPENKYETVVFPFYLKLGLTQKIDFGFSLRHVSHRIDSNAGRFSGSSTAQFSPEVKYAHSEKISFKAIWHLDREEEDDDLPIARGQDVEVNILLSSSELDWPLNLNVGYIFRGDYESDLGVNNQPKTEIQPGNIFQAKGAVEFPIRYHLSFLTELAYYNVSSQEIAGLTRTSSAGDALDVILGLTWSYKGWEIGGGAGFGLLDESHTSFDLERGAGDWMTKFRMSYKLKPRKPEKWD